MRAQALEWDQLRSKGTECIGMVVTGMGPQVLEWDWIHSKVIERIGMDCNG